jgi:glycosyltransferase involved in cell wall biosynthesis
MTQLRSQPAASTPVPPVSPSDTRPVVVLDPGLFFESGHHATFARLLKSECAVRSRPVVLFGARRIDHPPAGLTIRNLFRTSAYAPLSRWSPAESLDTLNNEVLEDLRTVPHRELRAAGLILFPTITTRIALGVARWIRELPEAMTTPVALILMFPPGWSGEDKVRQAETDLYRRAMTELAALPPGRVMLFAETEPIAGVFERLGAPPVRILPWPVMLAEPADAPVPFRARAMPPHVVHLGYTKQNRGIGLLADAAPALLDAHPGLRFTIQANYWDPTGVEEPVRRLESMGPRVRVIRGPLDPQRYADLLREADIVALPYNPAHYRELGSGVLAEAAALGKALVFPDHTWLAEQAKLWDLGAVLFDRYDAASFGRALDRAVRDRAVLLDRAERARPSWSHHRSPANFLNRVLDTVAAAGPTPAVASSPTPAPPLPASDTDFLVDGFWTPQTQMLRSIRDWAMLATDEPRTALSVDRNPTLNEILLCRWPGLTITEARWPEFDAQRLHQVPDGAYDLVFSHQVLEHIPKPWKAAAELVRVMRPGGLAIHTTCAANPRHGPPVFNDYYRFLPDGLEQLFDTDAGPVEVCVKASWGNRQALLYNHAIDDGHGVLGGRRFVRAVGEPNEENFPWATWIIFRKC